MLASSHLSRMKLNEHNSIVIDLPSIAPTPHRFPWKEVAWEIHVSHGTFHAKGISSFQTGTPTEEFTLNLWSLDQIQQLPGSWFVIARHVHTGEYVALTDRYGMECIFYATVPVGDAFRLILGKSFRSVSSELSKLGIPSELDLSTAVTTLGSNSLFLRSRWSSQTFSKHIKVVNVGEYLQFGPSGVNKYQLASNRFQL